jgi:AraC-like DNA-binding protein
MNHAGGHHRNGKGVNGASRQLVEGWQHLAQAAGYSVSALANSCGVSARTLERLFPRLVGQPPGRWLKRLRMQRALELLRDGSTVKETAVHLAYEGPSHFSREFKRHYGFAPSKCPQSHATKAAAPPMSDSAMRLSHLAMKS